MSGRIGSDPLLYFAAVRSPRGVAQGVTCMAATARQSSIGRAGASVGVYVSIRGWIQCDDAQRELIKQVVSADPDDLYNRGWTYSSGPSWTRYVFYGADIREQAVDWFLDQLCRIAALPASDDDNDRVCGLFLASHEVDGMVQWQVRNGQVIAAPVSGYEFLDE